MNARIKQEDVFASFHPLLNYLYFGYVVVVTVLFLHPVLLAISFVAALAWALYLGGRAARRMGLCFVLPLMVISAALNPVFNHEGVTILGYAWDDNPVTLESIIYGVCAAVMIGGVILWFMCYSYIMSSDKFVYLFGRVWPALSLIVSMALRFIPLYGRQVKRVASARRGVGVGTSAGGFIPRVRHGGGILSATVTWALENAIETSDSMRSRGYGLTGRTAYSIYSFGAGDRVMLIVLASLMSAVCVLAISGFVGVGFFPAFGMNALTPPALAAYACHAAVCALPFALDLKEDAAWRALKSGI
jgi:energy-coupling factor transport system permease protein